MRDCYKKVKYDCFFLEEQREMTASWPSCCFNKVNDKNYWQKDPPCAREECPYYISKEEAYEIIKGIKPIRCGQWIHIRTAGVIGIWKCSECDSTITANFAITNPANHDKFCYNCGAKMDGDTK